MKKAKIIIISGLMLVLVCVFFTACGGSSVFSVSITDSLGYDLTELYVSPSATDDWGDSFISENMCCNDDVQIINLEETDDNCFDVRAVDTDGDSYYFYSLPLSALATIDLYSSEDGYEAIVTPRKGNPISVAGTIEISAEIVAAPTANDLLDDSVAMPGFEDLFIPYPSTMQIAKSSADTCFIQFEAVNDPDNNNGISLNLIELGGSYEDRLNSASTAQEALVEIVGKVCDQTFPGLLIQNIGTEFFDSGSYYSALSYLWMSGEVFEESSSVPVRGVLECRYYGTDYILAVFTLADEGAIQNYFNISRNIFDTISLGSTWTTPKNSDSSVLWSDPGDYYYDYTEWSDPGDYYDGDYTEWSDPGDYYDGDYTEWSDPGDYYDGDYTEWSDPGDYYDY